MKCGKNHVQQGVENIMKTGFATHGKLQLFQKLLEVISLSALCVGDEL